MADTTLNTVLEGFMAASSRHMQRHKQARVKREDLAAGYMARIDVHMLDMTKAEKIKFLNTELEKWFERYKQFSTDVLAGRPLTSTATAWDYSQTIAALSVKIGSIERSAP
jgi:hypothetical protein